MIPRIINVVPKEDYTLLVSFEDGATVLYDVKDDIDQIPAFSDLKEESGLFGNVQLDESRTCIYWNDSIDLPSDSIYEYGRKV